MHSLGLDHSEGLAKMEQPVVDTVMLLWNHSPIMRPHLLLGVHYRVVHKEGALPLSRLA